MEQALADLRLSIELLSTRGAPYWAIYEIERKLDALLDTVTEKV